MTGVHLLLGALFLLAAGWAYREVWLDVRPYWTRFWTAEGGDPGTANWTTWMVFVGALVFTTTGHSLLS